MIKLLQKQNGAVFYASQCMLELLNNFIRTRLTVKSRDCNTLLGKAHTSNP